MPPRRQWSAELANAWYDAQPWLIGCNFIPSTASNQLEMWQAETFDVETIDRELAWAADLGFNTARVFLHNLLWQQDAAAFIGRIDQFLSISARHRIRPMFVLFDGVWNPRPNLGTQPEPRRRVHNAGWVQSPGADVLADTARHADLAPYVRGVVGHFAEDGRVLAWDLFNEPDNPNPAYRDVELPNKGEVAEALLRLAYDWAREAGPSQPITAGVWRGRWDDIDQVSSINRLMLDESDVVSFHSYEPPDKLSKRVDSLKPLGRPILLTEFLSRGVGSTFEGALPLLKERRIGAYCWGLVSGRTQTIYPWDSWAMTYEAEPDPWFHDVLRADGTPYSDDEVAVIQDTVRS